MLGLGFTEMILLAGIALVVMGPEKFPDVAKVFLRTIRDVRGYWDDAQRELAKEINPLKGELRELSKYKPEEIIDKMAGVKPEAAPEKVEEKSVEEDDLDHDLKEPGLSGYGVKVPEPEATQPDATATEPHADPYQPQQYNPYAVVDDDELVADNASHAEEKHELDDLSPPPRLEG